MTRNASVTSLGGKRAHGARRRILIVDDNREAADALAAVLHFLGYEAETRYSGAAGLDAVHTFEPDVAIWDVNMPGIGGYEAARLARQLSSGSRLLLVALTGLGTEKDRQDALAAGFDAHLGKPMDVNRLLSVIGLA